MSGLQKVIFLVFLVFAGCSKIQDLFTDYPDSVNKEKMLQLVNNQRAKGCQCGDTYMPPAKPLVWNELLEKAAQIHSEDMRKNDFFSHTGSDGSDHSQRIYGVGYESASSGENIGKGYVSEEDAFKGWLESAGHCKNMMKANFKEIGVATQKGYWTMVLAEKR